MYLPPQFPILVVDDFFIDPITVTEIAHTLTYHPSPDNRWPGERSRNLYEVEPYLWRLLCEKFFSLWYPTNEIEKIGYQVGAFFHKIRPLCSSSDSPLNTGWVHTDGPGDCLGAGVIYLEPDADPSCGTAIYNDPYGVMQNSNLWYEQEQIDKYKQQAISGQFSREEQEQLEKIKQYYDALFTPDIVVPNRYNRMIFYGHQYPHKPEYLGTKTMHDRLTLVFFINSFHGSKPPLLRLSRGV